MANALTTNATETETMTTPITTTKNIVRNINGRNESIMDRDTCYEATIVEGVATVHIGGRDFQLVKTEWVVGDAFATRTRTRTRTRNALRTNQTYATYANALAKFNREASKVGVDCTGGMSIAYVIACTPEGRFAPVVYQHAGQKLLGMCHSGITVIG